MAARWAIVVFSWTVAACGDDAAAGTGSDQPDAIAAVDAQVGGGVADAQPDVLDAAGADVGLPAWLTGTWLECGGDLTISQPDSATWRASGSACTVTSTLVWHAGTLDFTAVTGVGCPNGPPTWMIAGTQASFDGAQLTLVHPSLFAGLKRLSAKATRELWSVKADASGTGVTRLCFDANGVFYDGNWASADCSFIACGSIVAQVKRVGTQTDIWTECQGSCPCTSILVATQKTATAMSGSYSSASCAQAASGTFVASAQPFP